MEKYSLIATLLSSSLSQDSRAYILLKSPVWKAPHERQSQYLLQITKCLDESYCESFGFSYLSISKNRLLLSHIVLIRNGCGSKWVKRHKDSYTYPFLKTLL